MRVILFAVRRPFHERWAKRQRLNLHHGPALFWLDDWKTTIVLLLAVTGALIGLSWLFSWADKPAHHENWRTAEARVVGYKIMSWAEPRREGHNFIEYWAEYKLRYEVDGKPYEMWTNTDIVSSTRAGATGAAAHDMISARFVVSYNPRHPWQAEAKRE